MNKILEPPHTPESIRSSLTELSEQNPAAASAARIAAESSLPEMLLEVWQYFLDTPPTTGLGQVGRSLGGHLMVVNELEPMPPRLALRDFENGSIELAVRQQVYGRSFRNDRLALFIAGSERAIVVWIAADGSISLNKQPVPAAEGWESALREKITHELTRL